MSTFMELCFHRVGESAHAEAVAVIPVIRLIQRRLLRSGMVDAQGIVVGYD